MMSAGPFVAGLKCSGIVFGGFSSFAWQSGTLQLIAIHLITLHNILEFMQIAIIQTEAADFVKMYICVILNSFCHDCTCRWGQSDYAYVTNRQRVAAVYNCLGVFGPLETLDPWTTGKAG